MNHPAHEDWKYNIGNPLFYHFTNGMQALLKQRPSAFELNHGYTIEKNCKILENLVTSLSIGHIPKQVLPKGLRQPYQAPRQLEVEIVATRPAPGRSGGKRKERDHDRVPLFKAKPSEEHECFKKSRNQSERNDRFGLQKLMELANPTDKTPNGLSAYLNTNKDACLNMVCFGHCKDRNCQGKRTHKPNKKQNFKESKLFGLFKKYLGK